MIDDCLSVILEFCLLSVVYSARLVNSFVSSLLIFNSDFLHCLLLHARESNLFLFFLFTLRTYTIIQKGIKVCTKQELKETKKEYNTNLNLH